MANLAFGVRNNRRPDIERKNIAKDNDISHGNRKATLEFEICGTQPVGKFSIIPNETPKIAEAIRSCFKEIWAGLSLVDR